jgi:hypothetical protein
MEMGARACEKTIKYRRKLSEPVTGEIETQVIDDLVVGDKVWLQEIKTKRWNIPALGLEIRPSQRSVIGETPEGGVYLSNCRFTRKRLRMMIP